MYCVQIWDDGTEKVSRFYWVSTARRAYRIQAAYQRITGQEVFIEGERSNYNLDNACGY